MAASPWSVYPCAWNTGADPFDIVDIPIAVRIISHALKKLFELTHFSSTSPEIWSNENVRTLHSNGDTAGGTTFQGLVNGSLTFCALRLSQMIAQMSKLRLVNRNQ